MIYAEDKPKQPSRGSAETEALRARFAAFYTAVPVKVEPRAPQYSLPLTMDKLTNGQTAENLKDAALRELLMKNGFAADLPAPFADRIESFYDALKDAGTPVFITSDSLLHLYHIQFDETLREIEERQFHADALALTYALYDAAIRQARSLQGIPRQAALFNAAYFAVALECLAADETPEQLRQARTLLAGATDNYRATMEFQEKFPEAFSAVEAIRNSSPQSVSLDPFDLEATHKLLDEAVTKAPGKRLNYMLGAGLPAADAETLNRHVAAELVLIARHAGFTPSPLFEYNEDYSQYVPRGHYTRSAKLRSYFKALLWLGRMTALIKGGAGALVSQQTARVQTTAGVLAAELLATVELTDGRPACDVWARIYAVTAFYVGFADDLTPAEYRGAARKVFGERFRPEALEDEDKFRALQVELAGLRAPAIKSGTGNSQGAPIDKVSADELLKLLEQTKGFRLMGQRYIPDSHMLGTLVYPSVGAWGGGDFAFSTVQSPGGPVRGFPRGLDVMAVLGSARARQILKAERDDNYVQSGGASSYDDVLVRLRDEFEALDDRQWNQNLYGSWLYCLKALLQDSGPGYPSFMQTAAWQDKQLNAASGSWSQLRHDTILYAKQSYAALAGCPPTEPKMVEGYVEPVPEFYARVLALTRMTRVGLIDLKVLSAEATVRLNELEQIVRRLLAISIKELSNACLTADEYDFIRNFGGQLGRVVAGVQEEGLQTSIVADVHSDGNTAQVLEEGTGDLRALWVVYPMPDGGLVLGCGPAFSYYEFKQPMRERLSDEKWRQLLRAGEAPALPSWTGGFGRR